MTIQQDLNAAVASAVADAALLRQIVQGPAAGPGSEIVTSGGTVWSLARMAAEMQTALLAIQGGALAGAIGYTPVNRAGDTMTGPLALPGNPATGLQAAPKQYVDALSGAIATAQATADAAAAAAALKLALAGGTLTGALTLHADPAAALQAAPKQYVDSVVTTRMGWTQSADITIGNNQLIEWTHGMGVRPGELRFRLKCIVADNGWAVNDEIEFAAFLPNFNGPTIVTSTTKVQLYMNADAQLFNVAHKATFVRAWITHASWKLIAFARP